MASCLLISLCILLTLSGLAPALFFPLPVCLLCCIPRGFFLCLSLLLCLPCGFFLRTLLLLSLACGVCCLALLLCGVCGFSGLSLLLCLTRSLHRLALLFCLLALLFRGLAGGLFLRASLVCLLLVLRALGMRQDRHADQNSDE